MQVFVTRSQHPGYNMPISSVDDQQTTPTNMGHF